MKRTRLAMIPLAMMTGMGSPARAHGGVVVIYIPGRAARSWAVKRTMPYAVWEARSTKAPGSEVAFDRNDGPIDAAPLVPETLYASDRDLIEGNRVWLPKGGLLVKMNGAEGNRVCTWRFDDRAGQTEADAKQAKLPATDYDLCLEQDADGKAKNPKVMIDTFGGLMTITIPNSGMGRYRNDVGATNAIGLQPVESGLLPPRLQLQIFAVWKHGGTVCLHTNLADMKSQSFLNGEDRCFTGLNQSLRLAGGIYTVTAIGQQNSFTVRVDQPLNAHGVGPRVAN